jgi:hypothetical protein
MDAEPEGTGIPQKDGEIRTDMESGDIQPAGARRQSVLADLDSQPLSDLGVSVMDQEVLEANVAAEVRERLETSTDI